MRIDKDDNIWTTDKGSDLVVKFNSEGRVGSNHKTLYVYANTKGNTSHELQFDVEVEKKKW